MDTVLEIKGGTIPKQIKIVNKNSIISSAAKFEPSIEIQDAAEMAITPTKCWDRPRDKNVLTTILECTQELRKFPFKNLRGPVSDIVTTGMYKYSANSGVFIKETGNLFLDILHLSTWETVRHRRFSPDVPYC